jgi:hypothetical protein
MKELEMEITHPNLFAWSSTTPCPKRFLVTIILEAFKLKHFVLKLDEAGGDIFCGRIFINHASKFCFEILKQICVICVMKFGIFLTSQLFCFADDGSVFSP